MREFRGVRAHLNSKPDQILSRNSDEYHTVASAITFCLGYRRARLAIHFLRSREECGVCTCLLMISCLELIYIIKTQAMEDKPQKQHRAPHSGVKADKKGKGKSKQSGFNEKVGCISIIRLTIDHGLGLCTQIRAASRQTSTKKCRERSDTSTCTPS